MTHPRQTTDRAPAAAPHSPHSKKFYALLIAGIFAALVVTHLPLLGLPYYWDEAGYFIPAARDILLTGDPVPNSTLSNAHPPMVPAFIALAWKIFGFRVEVARGAMLLVAALALAGLFRLSERVAGRGVAWATVACTALYPVFFAQSSMAHLDMAAAALTIWGLVLYLPPMATATTDGNDASFDETSTVRRRLACVGLFALAALAKETAILGAAALAGWDFVCWLLGRLRRGAGRTVCVEPSRPLRHVLLWSLAPLPIFAWLLYHRSRTGYLFGNPEYFRYNVESTLSLARTVQTLWGRLWHVTAHMNLWALTTPAAVAMFVRPRRDEGAERRRIDVRVQLAFAVVVVAYVVALSIVGGAVLARYMLPVVPLVILVCVSTLRRRLRRWTVAVAAVCAVFVAGLFVNPRHSFPWEENLAYRDFILLHRNAAQFIDRNYADPRVLTDWPASDELKNPYFGYTPRPFRVVAVENFKREHLEAAAGRKSHYDLALLFSKHGGTSLEEALQVLGGRIVFREERRGQWVAVVEVSGER